MEDRKVEEAASLQPALTAVSVRNLGDPLLFTQVESLAGFAAEPAMPGQQIKVWTKLTLTSDEPLFHRLAENLTHVISHMAEQAKIGVDLIRANTVLLVLKPDATAEL
jgi:hypothetical protein